ncbi:MAG: hypothetical protein N838_21130 [Thiohalocapsa sp. PB-PSB1]|nr:MAG: hypothetical protein N838_21130 [Thiohalocapsa sp. PB-PSB1]
MTPTYTAVLIELIDVFDQSAPFAISLICLTDVRRVIPPRIPAFRRDFANRVDPCYKVVPKIPWVVGSWKTASDADYAYTH